MNNLKTSVVLSTYNGEKYIEEQLRSIFEQTVKPDEIIVCDDCSVDHTKEIVKKCLDGCGITNIFIEHERNRGVVKTFEEAIKKAHGDIVFLCDQDDVWCVNKIQTCLKYFLREPECSLVFADAYITDEKLNIKKESLWDVLDFASRKKCSNVQIIDEMLKRNIFTGMSMAFRRSILSGVKRFPTCMLHDEYIGWLALSSGHVVPINEKLSYYRQHDGNVVGVSKSTGLNELKVMKKKVSKSSRKVKNKFIVVSFMFEDGLIKSKIEAAGLFYKWRVGIFKMNRLLAIRQYILHWLKGDYRRYTSKTEKARIKDILCIIL